MKKVLEQSEAIKKIAEKYQKYHDFYFIGRGFNFPVAMEGALKLKEISYIHAEGVAAGELKHGPIALVDKGVPVVALVPHSDTYEKVLSNVEEVNNAMSTIIGENACAHIILEGGELAYINSTFIGYLTDWFSRLEEKECRLSLANFRPNVMDTLTIVGLTHLMQHFPNIEEAKLALMLRGSNQKVEQNCLIP